VAKWQSVINNISSYGENGESAMAWRQSGENNAMASKSKMKAINIIWRWQ